MVCTIDAEKYGLRIDGEKDGDVTVQHHTEKTFFKRSPTGVLESTKVEVNQTLIYASGNAYDFIGEITIDALTDDVTYRITATGDSLAAEQTCTG